MSLKHSILATLSRTPRSGYEIAKSIEGGIGFFWKATHQQIYKDLGALEAAGWVSFTQVEQHDAPAKKVYQVTKAGLKELKRWILEDQSAALIRDPFLIKLFAGHLVKSDEILAVLEKQRAKRLATLDQYAAIEKKYFNDPERLPREMQFQYLVVKRGISHARGWLEWAEDVEAFVRSMESATNRA